MLWGAGHVCEVQVHRWSNGLDTPSCTIKPRFSANEDMMWVRGTVVQGAEIAVSVERWSEQGTQDIYTVCRSCVLKPSREEQHIQPLRSCRCMLRACMGFNRFGILYMLARLNSKARFGVCRIQEITFGNVSTKHFKHTTTSTFTWVAGVDHIQCVNGCGVWWLLEHS